MINHKPDRACVVRIGFVSLGLLFLAMLLVAGCASDGSGSQNAPSAGAPTTAPTAKATKGRAQIWGETCARCHSMRSPDWYSDAQWEAAMMQMRVRGYLTGEEYREILAFLKSAN